LTAEDFTCARNENLPEKRTHQNRAWMSVRRRCRSGRNAIDSRAWPTRRGRVWTQPPGGCEPPFLVSTVIFLPSFAETGGADCVRARPGVVGL